MGDMAKIIAQGFKPHTVGIHLSMDEEEKKLASIVYSVTVEEVARASTNETGAEPEETSGFEREVSRCRFEASKGNLNRILELFEQTYDAREQFVENFQHWKLLRLENLKQLAEISEIIHTDKKRFNVGKLVGGAAGIAGAAALAGAMLFPPAAPAILPAWLGGAAMAAYVPTFLLPAAAAAPVLGPAAVGGGVAAGLGGAAMAGATAAEVLFLQKRMEAAKVVLKADQMGFQYVEGWFRHTKALIDAVEAVMGFDAMQSWVEDLNTSLSWFKDFQHMGDEKFELFKSVLKLCIRRVLSRFGVVLAFGNDLSPVVITFLFAVFWLNRRNNSLFDCIARVRGLTTHLRKFLDATELQRLIAAVGANGAAAAELIALSLAHRTAMGAFAGVGFVFNTASVVLTAVDIQKGCRSKHAEEVTKVVEKLKEEYDVLEDVYINLTSIKGPEP